MDKPPDAYEIEDEIAELIAEDTARLLRELDEIEGRLDLLEYALLKSLLN